ncbi:hypothetical protein PMAYCL1PPCAC_08613, partial [Pristionchus mayeri]
NRIRKSVMRLFMQLFTPLLLLSVPGALIIAALRADGLLSFEQCLSLFTVMLLHPIAHNLLLILTPNFRQKIARLI